MFLKAKIWQLLTQTTSAQRQTNFWLALVYLQPPQQSYATEHASWSKLRLYLGWWLRNPLQGLTGDYFGLVKPITVTAVLGHYANNNFSPDGGWLVLNLRDSRERQRPFISYRGKFVEAYAGWRPAGQFGLALRKSGAKPETGKHVS